jgi:archaellin
LPSPTKERTGGSLGLETAILLIIFVVESSAFAYTVMTTDIYSFPESNEALNAVIEELSSLGRLNANILLYRSDADIDEVTTSIDD